MPQHCSLFFNMIILYFSPTCWMLNRDRAFDYLVGREGERWLTKKKVVRTNAKNGCFLRKGCPPFLVHGHTACTYTRNNDKSAKPLSPPPSPPPRRRVSIRLFLKRINHVVENSPYLLCIHVYYNVYAYACTVYTVAAVTARWCL